MSASSPYRGRMSEGKLTTFLRELATAARLDPERATLGTLGLSFDNERDETGAVTVVRRTASVTAADGTRIAVDSSELNRLMRDVPASE